MVTLPKHRQGCLTPSKPPAPRPLFPQNCTRTPLLTQFTPHKPHETSFKKTQFSPHDVRYSSGVRGSYLCRRIPQTGSSCPLSFHLNNACSSGSQARAIWESQPPLRGRCTNTSIVLLPKSLPLVVTPCVRQPRQHSSALTQLDINSCPWSRCHNTRNRHGRVKHPQLYLTVFCFQEYTTWTKN